MTGRAYIGEMLSELVDKQVNVQKESLKKLSGFTQNSRKPTQNSRKPTKKCAMKMKEANKEKNDRRLKYFLMEEGVYKACGKLVPWISNNFRSTILHTLKVLFV